MRITDFDVYKDLLKEKSGLVITPDKSYLLESRLSPIAKKWDYASVEAMSAALQGVGADPKLVNEVVEAMTTNETSFFRDAHPFKVFEETVIPYFLKGRVTKRLKMWCAAASSDQEPYSLCITLKEMGAAVNGWSFDLKATDISHDILAQARKGIYSQFEVQRGLPIQTLVKYFEQEGDKWHLKQEIRDMVRYEYFNLLDSMAALGRFDVIFCRNVLIYFDEPTKSDILGRMHSILEDDGFLFLGGAETVLGLTNAFKPVPGQRGLYAKDGSAHLEAKKPPGLAQSSVSA